jgi:phosphoadenosine phosphosulfate reductase
MTFEEKVEKAREVIRETADRFPHDSICIAWTGGKDSTVILHMVREMYDGKIPFKVMFNDSTFEFKEIMEFVDRIEKDWEFDLIRVPHMKEDLDAYHKTDSKDEKMEILRIAKINAINFALDEYDINAFVAGIRWDEHEARSDETYFSERPSHMRVHPILHFTLEDIWTYIKTFDVPYVNLYDKGYKSLGEEPFTKPVDDPNAPERAGREATKEKTMNRLRKLGYW